MIVDRIEDFLRITGILSIANPAVKQKYH